jgi:tryptophan synthase alpha chain
VRCSHKGSPAQGIDVFCAQAAEEGADGILVPDLPLELAHELAPHLQHHGLQQVMMVTPLTDEARLQAMLPFAGGFWYVVSRLGVTGVELRYDEQLATTLQRLKTMSDLPACVGFGISTPQHVQAMGALGADGAITASAIIQHLRQAGLYEASFTAQQAWVSQYVSEMVRTP